MRIPVLLTLIAASLPQTAAAISEDPTEPFTLLLPSGLEIQARQVGLQFHDPKDFGSQTPVYQIDAKFRSTRYDADDPLTVQEHYKLDVEQGETLDPFNFPALTQDTKWLCDLTKDHVHVAIQNIPNLPEDLLAAVKETPPTFFSVLIEMVSPTQSTDPTSEAFSVLHDLRTPTCTVIKQLRPSS